MTGAEEIGRGTVRRRASSSPWAGNAGTYGRAAYALNAGACSKTHAQTVKNCPQDKILRAVQMSEIIDGNSMAEAFYKISLA